MALLLRKVLFLLVTARSTSERYGEKPGGADTGRVDVGGRNRDQWRTGDDAYIQDGDPLT